jgi:signal transduction histidine kinase/ligand-binding sensor domain-containing protein
VGTNGKGLDKFDPSNNVFIHYKHQLKNSSSLSQDTVTAIAQDKDGFLWIGTVSGLDKLDINSGKFEHLLHDSKNNRTLTNDHINSILKDDKGTMWVGTDGGGLNRFDKQTNSFTRYYPGNQHGLPDNDIQSLFEDSKGNFWIGASHNILFSIDRAKGTFEYYSGNPSNPEIISAPVEKKNASNTRDAITFINEDAAGGIWIGTMRSGINRYDPATHKTLHFESNNDNQFKDKSGQSAYSSVDGLFWISTFEGGLYKIDPILNTIPHYSANSPVFAIYHDPNNILWVGTSNGLVRNDRNNGNTQVFSYDPFNPASISNNIIFSIYEDKQNKLWIGTDGGGLNLFNKSTHTFNNYRHESKNSQSLVNDVVYAMCEDGDRNMWVGTGNGLDLMDKITGRFTHYLHSSKDTATIGNNFIETIIKDNKNDIWIGSGYRGGINKLMRSSNKFTHFLRGRSIFSLFLDSENTIWAGTDSGLYYMKPSFTGFSEFIDSSLNTSSTAVICIVEDPQKRLWLNSSLGIIALDRNRRIIGLYSKRYGVATTNYVLRAGYANSRGEIFFSGTDGYYSFDQNLLTPNLKLPRLMLTDFRLMDQSVKPGTGLLNQEINNTNELRLSYKQNVFSFDFAALDYTSPEDNQHFFMLENYDNGWHKSGTDRKAYYFNVPPGHYIFRVKGFNGNGFGTEKKVDIIISPPWWRTWWAYILFASVLAGSIWGIIYYRGRKLRLENKLLEDTVNRRTVELQQSLENLRSAQSQLIQSEKMASLGELTAGIAHEIQNPLNFVNNFSELNKELVDELQQAADKENYHEVKAIAKDIRDNEEKINHHGRRADAIVKGMLQHSRTSTGQKQPADINALADEYLRLSYHGLRAKDKSFNATIQTDFDKNIGTINIIPQDIGRVLLNLYNNAFYAVTEKNKQQHQGYQPTVSVSTKKFNDRVELRVKDNGNGIPQKVLDKIFQPFFTTKPTGQGTGLGLSLSYDIIKAHGGELKVEAEEDEGAEFIIRLSMNKNNSV